MKSLILILFLGFIVFLFGCKKTHSETQNSFTWVHNGSTYQANVDSALLFATLTSNHIIFAGTGTSYSSLGTGLKIITPSVGQGTHNFPVSNGLDPIQVMYVEPNGNTLIALNGFLTIVENKGNKLSGSLRVSLSNASLLTADFVNVPIRP